MLATRVNSDDVTLRDGTPNAYVLMQRLLALVVALGRVHKILKHFDVLLSLVLSKGMN